jgi:hypothetical protein
MFVAVVLVAPIAEEWVFRGALWTFIEASFGRAGALLITSLLFALYHLDPLHVLSIIPTALFLAALRGLSGSVWPGVLAHAINNLLGVFAILVLPEDVVTRPVEAACALIVAAVGLVACWLWGRPGSGEQSAAGTSNSMGSHGAR